MRSTNHDSATDASGHDPDADPTATETNSHRKHADRRPVSRRDVLTATGGALVAGLAGCSQLQGTQSFEATAVVIHKGDRRDLVLAETGRDSTTTTRDAPGGGKVKITSESAAYRRGRARSTPTLLEKFTSMVNGTPGSGSNISALASRAGIDAIGPIRWLEGVDEIGGDRFSLVVPGGARGGDGVTPEEMLALVPGAALGSETVTYGGDAPGAFLPYADFAPGSYIPERTRPYIRTADFAPGAYKDASSTDVEVFIPNPDSWIGRVGLDSLPDGAEPVEPGETIGTSDTVIATPANRLFSGGRDPFTAPKPALYDHGYVLAPGGTPFGLGALSTPAAKVGGEPQNPIHDMATPELLKQDAARRMLGRIGVTDADTVEWITGPTTLDPGPMTTTLLGTETGIETLGGVVSGEDGRWGVLVNVARVEFDDDKVVAASGVVRPVGTADGGMEALRTAVTGSSNWVPRARKFTAAAMGRLERARQ